MVSKSLNSNQITKPQLSNSQAIKRKTHHKIINSEISIQGTIHKQHEMRNIDFINFIHQVNNNLKHIHRVMQFSGSYNLPSFNKFHPRNFNSN